MRNKRFILTLMLITFLLVSVTSSAHCQIWGGVAKGLKEGMDRLNDELGKMVRENREQERLYIEREKMQIERERLQMEKERAKKEMQIPVQRSGQANEIFHQNSGAVVLIVTYDGSGKPFSQGSGFIVRQDGFVVTNYHVIKDAKGIKVKAGSKVFDVIGVIDADKESDIAILKINANYLPTVELGNLQSTNIGERIYVIGSPRGLENTISDGILSGIRKDNNITVLQITAPISSGSSGGPVFNQMGQVIGVATFGLKESQGLNFAMPVDGIKAKIGSKSMVANKSISIDAPENSAEYWRNLGLAHYKAGKHQEAIEAYKQAIRIKPDYGVVHYELGGTYFKSGRYQEAIGSLNEAIRIKPDSAQAHEVLASVFHKMKRFPEAIKSLEQAIRIKPDFAQAHYGLGMTYAALGNKESALAEYNILKDLSPRLAQQLIDRINATH